MEEADNIYNLLSMLKNMKVVCSSLAHLTPTVFIRRKQGLTANLAPEAKHSGNMMEGSFLQILSDREGSHSLCTCIPDSYRLDQKE